MAKPRRSRSRVRAEAGAEEKGRRGKSRAVAKRAKRGARTRRAKAAGRPAVAGDEFKFPVKPRCSSSIGAPYVPPSGTELRAFWADFWDQAVDLDTVTADSNSKADKNAGISDHMKYDIVPMMGDHTYEFDFS